MLFARETAGGPLSLVIQFIKLGSLPKRKYREINISKAACPNFCCPCKWEIWLQVLVFLGNLRPKASTKSIYRRMFDQERNVTD